LPVRKYSSFLALDLGAAPFGAAAARRVIFVGGGGAPLIFAGGGGVTKMSAAAASAASTKNLLCQKACTPCRHLIFILDHTFL
jgi:hypothetical protein